MRRGIPGIARCIARKHWRAASGWIGAVCKVASVEWREKRREKRNPEIRKHVFVIRASRGKKAVAIGLECSEWSEKAGREEESYGNAGEGEALQGAVDLAEGNGVGQVGL